MTAVHFRPKYSIEQYLVLFSFSAPLDSFPTILVEIVSGSATDAETFAGAPIIQGSDIFVRVTGGTPGCVYRVTCSGEIEGVPVKKQGLIAVMPTSAVEPFGVPEAPLTRSVTTPPYPVYEEGRLDTSLKMLSGLFLQTPEDYIDVSVAALGGQIRDFIVFLPPQPPEESVDLGVVPIGGGLKDVIVYLPPQPPEEAEIHHLLPLGGDIKTVVVFYTNYPPEFLDTALTPLGGDINAV